MRMPSHMRQLIIDKLIDLANAANDLAARMDTDEDLQNLPEQKAVDITEEIERLAGNVVAEVRDLVSKSN